MRDRVANDSPLRFSPIAVLAATFLMAAGVAATPVQTSRVMRALGRPLLSDTSQTETAQAKSEARAAPPNSMKSTSGEPRLEMRFGVLRIEVPEGSRALYGAVAANPDDPEWVRLSIERDLDEEVASGEMREDVADRIAFEIEGLAGAYYKIPSLSLLKRDIGFPEDAWLALSDQAELLRVHIQRSLDVSPATAEYLTHLLGMDVEDEAAEVIAATPKTPDSPTFGPAFGEKSESKNLENQ